LADFIGMTPWPAVFPPLSGTRNHPSIDKGPTLSSILPNNYFAKQLGSQRYARDDLAGGYGCISLDGEVTMGARSIPVLETIVGEAEASRRLARAPREAWYV
jgi:hypothetical protein